MLAGLLKKHGLKARVAEREDKPAGNIISLEAAKAKARVPIVSRRQKQLCAGTRISCGDSGASSLRQHDSCRLLDGRCGRRAGEGAERDGRSRCLCRLISPGRGNGRRRGTSRA